MTQNARSRSRRGFTLVEVMATAMILGLTVVMALAVFPFSRLLQDRSKNVSMAAAILQRKMEQVRNLDSQQINTTGLRAAAVVDAGSGGPAYPFTATEQVATSLRGGTGVLTVTGAGTDLVRVDITVTWTAMRGQQGHLTGTTYVADKSIWMEP